MVAAWWGLAVTLAALVGARVVLELLGRVDWPILVYRALAAVLGYGPMVAYCTFASRRWGTGSLATDLGLRLRWKDLAGAGHLAVRLGRRHRGGHRRAGDPVAHDLQHRGHRPTGDRGVLIAFLIVAVVVAPVAEEMMFRGVVMRGLASVAPIGPGHRRSGPLLRLARRPGPRLGNLGLMVVLAAVGVVFGKRPTCRRLGPAIAGRTLYNAAVLAIVLLSTPDGTGQIGG